MTQIRSQSKAYRDLGLLTVARYSENKAHELFCHARWGSTKNVTCPYCGTVDEHYPRRQRKQWRCKDCDGIFSVTTGTPLADRKLPFRKILVLIFLFGAAPRSEPANKIHSTIRVTLRTAYILYGKLREALWQQRDTTLLTGVVQIDGGHFCGKPRRANKRKRITSFAVNSRLRNRKASIAPLQKGEKLEPWNVEKLKNRRVALVMRQLAEPPCVGASRTRVVIVRAEVASTVINAIRANVAPNSQIMTDGSPAYTQLSRWYKHDVVEHSTQYSTPEGVNQNQAESYFARLRRAEIGVLRGMRHQYFALYAHEMAWREDVRHLSLKEKFLELLAILMRCGLSGTWRGYNQGHRLGKEHDGLPTV